MDPVKPPDLAAQLDLRRAARGVLPGLVFALVLVALAGTLLREPLLEVGAAFVGAGGFAGTLLASLALDAIPGVGAQPIIFLAWTGGMGFFEVLLAAGAGGTLAAAVAWSGGRLLARQGLLRGWLDRTGLSRPLHEHTVKTVFLAAILPFPYALVTIAAGAARVPLPRVLLGACGRFVKALLNLTLIAIGWQVGG